MASSSSRTSTDALVGPCPSAHRLDRGHGLGRGVGVASVVHGDVAPVGRQRQRAGAPDPPAPSRDEGTRRRAGLVMSRGRSEHRKEETLVDVLELDL